MLAFVGLSFCGGKQFKLNTEMMRFSFKEKKQNATVGTYVTEFGLFFPGTPAASLQDHTVLQTEVLLLGHSGTAPSLLKTQLLL